MVEDVEGFNLPWKWKPGADLMSKMLLFKRSKNNEYDRSLSDW